MQETAYELPWKALLRAALAVLAAALIAWAGLNLGIWRVPGVRVAGVMLPAPQRTAAELQRRAQLWQQQSLTLRVGYHIFQPTRLELGWGLRVEDAERELQSLGRSPNPLVSLRALWLGLFGRGHDLRWMPRALAPNALESYLEVVRSRIDRLPVAGAYSPEGAPIAGLAGEAVDLLAARSAIERALLRGDTELVIATLVTPPPPGYRRVEGLLDQLHVLMTVQETAFRPGTGRATNIALAARALHGVVLLPGATFSFNQVVGKRELTRGFASALELSNGELVEGVGGGVCQVAGTLHAAAFFAGLRVLEYRAHSRLSRLAYLPPGLDAMVAWPDSVSELRDTKDMRLQNPYPFPVRVEATIVPAANQNLLRVALFGAAPPFRVEFEFAELERIAAGEIQRTDASLPPGETRIKQHGLAGLVIARRRTTFTPLGRFAEETRIAYPPTPRIVLVGPASRR